MSMPEPTPLDDLSDDLRRWVKAELAPDERLLWAGYGETHRGTAGCGCLNTFPAFLVILGAAGVLATSATPELRASGNDFVRVSGLVSLVIGSVCLAWQGFSWLSRYLGGATHRRSKYALTDRRAILWLPQPRRAVETHSILRGHVDHIYRNEYPDGTGDVRWSPLRMSVLGPCGFEGIADVRRVEELAHRVLLGYDTPSPDRSHSNTGRPIDRTGEVHRP